MSVPRLNVEGVKNPSAASQSGIPLLDLDYAVVDVETTGWSPDEAGITEIGVVRTRSGRILGEFASLVNPGAPVPPGIAELTGITDQMLAPAPTVAAVLPALLSFARGCVLIAHNAPFDLGFLTAACEACGLAWPGFTVLDTATLARALLGREEVPDRKLGTLAAFFRVQTVPCHRALADARATAAVLRPLLIRLAGQGIGTLDQLEPWLAAREAEAAVG